MKKETMKCGGSDFAMETDYLNGNLAAAGSGKPRPNVPGLWPIASCLAALLIVFAVLLFETPEAGMRNPDEHQIAGFIRKLDREPYTLEVHLGALWPRDVSPLERIVAYGPTAVPQVAEALHSRNGRRVGYAAFMLWRLGRLDFKQSAERELAWFQSQPQTEDTFFAVEALRKYSQIAGRNDAAGSEVAGNEALRHPERGSMPLLSEIKHEF